MRKIREVLRLKQKGHSHREITAAVRISDGSVSDYLGRARAALAGQVVGEIVRSDEKDID